MKLTSSKSLVAEYTDLYDQPAEPRYHWDVEQITPEWASPFVGIFKNDALYAIYKEDGLYKVPKRNPRSSQPYTKRDFLGIGLVGNEAPYWISGASSESEIPKNSVQGAMFMDLLIQKGLA